jgi:hypothetical protein
MFRFTRAFLLCAALVLGACDRKPASARADAANDSHPPAVETAPASDASGPQVMKDPVREEVWDFKVRTRQHLNQRDFAQLEEIAAGLQKEQAEFDDGSWKIDEFYEALLPRDDDPDSLWELHEEIRKDWILQYPESMTAKVAMMNFLNTYAWRARGADWASNVTNEGWRLFYHRLNRSQIIAERAAKLDGADPVFYRQCLTVALGLGWPKDRYDALVDEAHRAYPTYWRVDTSRAYSLLPRWHGEPGDWEAFALETSSRPDGLQDELYARIVLYLDGFYDNVFRETDAQWEKTREGLDILVEKYPRSLRLLTDAGWLAVLANDREAASHYFRKLDHRCLKNAWRSLESFTACETWALDETGQVENPYKDR